VYNSSVESYVESREAKSGLEIVSSSSQFTIRNPLSCELNKKQSEFLSRSECNKRSLVKAASDPSQMCISDYLQISIEKLISENKRLSMLLSHCAIQEYREAHISKTPSFTNILKQISNKNLGQSPTHHRHLPSFQ